MKADQNTTNKGLNILVADDVHELLLIGLKEAGNNVLYLPDAKREEILARITEMDVLVIRTKTMVDREMMDAGKKLSCIARAGAGLDNVDEVYASARNITCFNAGEANADAVGEHALGMLLMLLNNLGRADREVRQGLWRREANRGTELAGKTVGIIGFGNTGKAVARKLSGFNVKVLVYDKYLFDYTNDFAAESTLDQIFEEADIVTLHIPLTNETNEWVNQDFLGRFKKEIYLMNLSRGKILKTTDLVKSLVNGKVLGAALDVLENEDLQSLDPLQENDFKFLIASEKVVLAPHIGGWTVESYRKISKVLLDKLLTFRLSS